MVASILIIVVSTALLIYWFRYTCVLILQTRADKDYTTDLAHANHLQFLEIQGNLIREAPVAELAALQKSLERDYRLLTFLIAHTASLEVGGLTLEQRLLMLDFRVMRVLASMGRWIGTSRVRSALQEMASILSHLANAMGERIEGASQA